MTMGRRVDATGLAKTEYGIVMAGMKVVILGNFLGSELTFCLLLALTGAVWIA